MMISIGRAKAKKLEDEILESQKINNLRLYKICRALLLINSGYNLEEIGEILNVSFKTVYTWLKEFMVQGFSYLRQYHYRGRGRPAKLSKYEKKILYKTIVKGPEKSGFDCGCWNSSMVREVILKKFHVKYNPRYVSSLLKGIGLSYQKACFESDHLDEKKRAEWVNKTWPAILREAKRKNAVIIFDDEVSFAQWGSLSRTWAPIGQQPKIKTTGKRKGLKMFGAIEFFSGGFVSMECEGRFSGKSYIKFLKKVLKKFAANPVILIEDGAPYHRSAIVNKYKEDMKKLRKLYTHRLPSYSPDYNPIEKLWKNTKRDATHLKYFPTFEDLRSAVASAFRKYMRDAQKVICVMSKLRQDAGVVS